MARALSIARVRVTAGQRAEWLATVRQLATLLEARGQHLWVFQAEADEERWIEFTECKERDAHRSVGPRSAEEAALETRLRALATYDADASALWAGVPLDKDR